MKSNLLLTALFMGFLCSPVFSANDLEINLYLYEKETSKDSNWQSVRLELKKNKLTIKKSFGGRNRRKPVSKTLTLKPGASQVIIQRLQKKGLLKSITEKQAKAGYGRAVKLSLMIKVDSKKVSSFIEGRSRISGGVPKTNLQNLAYYRAARSLIYFIKRQAE